jgi:hypothetical protein
MKKKKRHLLSFTYKEKNDVIEQIYLIVGSVDRSLGALLSGIPERKAVSSHTLAMDLELYRDLPCEKKHRLIVRKNKLE